MSEQENAGAKPAKKPAAAAKAPEVVTCRVTKLGAGRISTGERAPADYTTTIWDEKEKAEVEVQSGDVTYPKGAEIELPRAIADDLEDRHYVEIQ